MSIAVSFLPTRSTSGFKTIKTCSSHSISKQALIEMVCGDLKFTIQYAKENKEQFIECLRRKNEIKTKREIRQTLKEIEESENRIKELDTIIQNLYEDKVKGHISEERYLKLSENYENEQKQLTGKTAILKGNIEMVNNQLGNISKFMVLVNRYSDFEELTPDILHAFCRKDLRSRERKNRRSLQAVDRNHL